ncbi:uncharacterized protein K441DRAFT_486572, partial [Cenococcum geophilum 1.58]|uniref:uncharacterized protein n=1 Tax=Cenococcum geophilum 1.58 TaxID=794803 RepID=UPI00358FA1F9
VRLLFLHPGTGNEEIYYHLEHISLQGRRPIYEALSYPWDHDIPAHTIRSPHGCVSVGSNLYSALKQLRLPEVVRVLWIDYLWIDQSDVEERCLQVRIMGDVFFRAVRVIIWLGEETQDVGDAFHVIRKLLEGAILKELDWQPLINLLHRSWFHRLWVIQEVANAKCAVVLCG